MAAHQQVNPCGLGGKLLQRLLVCVAAYHCQVAILLLQLGPDPVVPLPGIAHAGVVRMAELAVTIIVRGQRLGHLQSAQAHHCDPDLLALQLAGIDVVGLGSVLSALPVHPVGGDQFHRRTLAVFLGQIPEKGGPVALPQPELLHAGDQSIITDGTQSQSGVGGTAADQGIGHRIPAVQQQRALHGLTLLRHGGSYLQIAVFFRLSGHGIGLSYPARHISCGIDRQGRRRLSRCRFRSPGGRSRQKQQRQQRRTQPAKQYGFPCH